MGKANFSDEFKRDAVDQIVVRGYSVREVSKRLGVSTHSLYKWMKQLSSSATDQKNNDIDAENRRLKKELARVIEERDILKKAAVHSIRHRNISYSLSAGVIKPSVFRGRVLRRFAIKSISV